MGGWGKANDSIGAMLQSRISTASLRGPRLMDFFTRLCTFAYCQDSLHFKSPCVIARKEQVAEVQDTTRRFEPGCGGRTLLSRSFPRC